jgi:hypothetical protein
MRLLRHIAIVVAMLALALPASAAAKGYQDVIRDCAEDGQIDGHQYSQHDLDQARHHIPSDVDEYTSCRDAIATALARGRSSGGGGGGQPPSNPALTTSAGATAYNQKDYNSLKDAAKADSKARPRVNIGTHDVAPGAGKTALLTDAAAANSIPSSVLGSMVALGLLTLAGTMLLVMRRWPAARRVALRLFRR